MATTMAIRVGGDWRVARTNDTHECVCGDPIRKGTRYIRWATKVGTAFTVTKEADHMHADEKRAWAENYDG